MVLMKPSMHNKENVRSGKVEDGGVDKWLVVFAAFMTHLITHGIVYSYGILFISFEDVFGVSIAEISWIASITTGALYLSGPLASTCLRRHGSRIVALTGSILSFFGCLITVFVSNLYLIYISLGLLTGIGYGLIFIPAVVEVTMNFKKHRALACGIALSGAGAGAFIFSPLIELLLDVYSWRGTFLVCSGLLLNCIPCSLFFRSKYTVKRIDENSAFKINHEIEKQPFGNNEFIEVIHVNKECDNIEHDNGTEINEECVTQKMLRSHANKSSTEAFDNSLTERERLRNISCLCCGIPNASLFQILRQREMILFYSAQILFFIGFYFPFIGMPSLAIQQGNSESKAVWIISSMGISTVIGRVVLGFLSDRSFLNSLFLYKGALLVAGVSTASVPLFSNYAALIVYALAFGLSTAVLLSQTTVVLVEIIGIDKMSDAMGFNNMFSGFGALIGPPVMGMLFDKTNTFTYPFIASGLSMATGGVLLFLMKFCETK